MQGRSNERHVDLLLLPLPVEPRAYPGRGRQPAVPDVEDRALTRAAS